MPNPHEYLSDYNVVDGGGNTYPISATTAPDGRSLRFPMREIIQAAAAAYEAGAAADYLEVPLPGGSDHDPLAPYKFYDERIEVRPAIREVLLDGVARGMTPKEYILVAFLGLHKGVVQTRDAIRREIWPNGDHDYVVPAALTVHILRARKALAPEGNAAIVTSLGVGYYAAA